MKRILLVEDSTTQAFFTTRVLEKNGFQEQGCFRYEGPDERFRGRQVRTFKLSRKDEKRMKSKYIP